MAHYARAVEQIQQGEKYRAIEALDEAIRLDPQFWPAYSLRAGAYIDIAEFERAVEDSDQAIRLEEFQRGVEDSTILHAAWLAGVAAEAHLGFADQPPRFDPESALLNMTYSGRGLAHLKTRPVPARAQTIMRAYSLVEAVSFIEMETARKERRYGDKQKRNCLQQLICSHQ
jgi:tetratricopeptide (TPR) repeat protein